MTGARWQSYATPKLGPVARARFVDYREREAERQADAAYRLSLRDAHDEGLHVTPVALCDFCERESAA